MEQIDFNFKNIFYISAMSKIVLPDRVGLKNALCSQIRIFPCMALENADLPEQNKKKNRGRLGLNFH